MLWTLICILSPEDETDHRYLDARKHTLCLSTKYTSTDKQYDQLRSPFRSIIQRNRYVVFFPLYIYVSGLSVWWELLVSQACNCLAEIYQRTIFCRINDHSGPWRTNEKETLIWIRIFLKHSKLYARVWYLVFRKPELSLTGPMTGTVRSHVPTPWFIPRRMARRPQQCPCVQTFQPHHYQSPEQKHPHH